jgi:hypothetical protein
MGEPNCVYAPNWAGYTQWKRGNKMLCVMQKKETNWTLTRSETEIRNIWSNWTDKPTEPCFYHSTENDKIPISSVSHFLKFLCQPILGTLAKPLKPTHIPSFPEVPNFARISPYWRFFDFQIKP